ncbi:hypothetical protein Cob_v000511 [Colletotrichum orbiculare MAFF 240422]|uniref:Uncharacterized protein n=1 Tax=Colletotrichum orbiculare (strain 104-T / ATCC 96160 / CBS 514.97 / LARS 414 / MAFF 240422) TaxID=1213857 RepID=A0A484G7V7_COLOR|nr:hypothetical protein Cob_v000511 [Colletotrichum orbiculare MAFF 240422]
MTWPDSCHDIQWLLRSTGYSVGRFKLGSKAKFGFRIPTCRSFYSTVSRLLLLLLLRGPLVLGPLCWTERPRDNVFAGSLNFPRWLHP